MPLREVLLIAIVLVACLSAFLKPIYGLYAYIWFATLRPDVLAFCENELPFSLALAVCTGLGALAHIPRAGVLFRNPITITLLVLQVPLALSAFAAQNPAVSVPYYLDFLKTLLVILLIPVLVRTERDLRGLFLAVAAGLGFLSFRYGVYGLVHGGVDELGGYGTDLWDNNQIGLALATFLPICWYCRSLVSSRWVKLGLLAMVFTTTLAIVMTHSRGGSIAAGLGLLLIAWRSRRKVFTFGLLAACAGYAVYLMQDTYLARMETLGDVRAERSAASRLDQAGAAIAMWKDYPLLGVGFGQKNYSLLVGRYLDSTDQHVAHNSYLQTLADSGIFAALLYTGLLFGAILWLRKSIRRGGPWQTYPKLLQASLVVFAVGSSFYSFQRYDLLYILLMCAAAWRDLEPNLEPPAAASEESAEPEFATA